MIDVQAAALAVNVSTRTIRRWIAAGMPTTVVHGQRRIDIDDLHGWALRNARQCHSIRDRSVALHPSPAPPASGALSLGDA